MKDDSTEFFVGIDLGDVENKVAILDRNGADLIPRLTMAAKAG